MHIYILLFYLRYDITLYIYNFRKKYAIADLSNTIGGKSFVEVSVIAWNWISDDGSKCVYPTYLPPKKQAIAIQDCMAKIGGQF